MRTAILLIPCFMLILGIACQTAPAARDWDHRYAQLCAGDPDLQHFDDRHSELEAQRDDLAQIYGPTHKSVRGVDAELRVCDDFIDTRQAQIADTLGPKPK